MTKFEKNKDNLAQETICNFFIHRVRIEPASKLLQEFNNLFILQNVQVNFTLKQARDRLVVLNQEDYFLMTLKRCCYILINNWATNRHHQQDIYQLIQFFSQNFQEKQPLSTMKQKSRQWLKNFIASKDYETLQIFAAKYQSNNGEVKTQKKHWSRRYDSYRLMNQAIDQNNLREQQEAAYTLSQKLNHDFKFKLAMYTARSRVSSSSNHKNENPTLLGEDILHLIQTVLVRRKHFDYRSIANIFLKQTEGSTYQDLKESLLKYLVFSLEGHGPSLWLKDKIRGYLDPLYTNRNHDVWDSHLLLRTCNRLIDALLNPDPEDETNPFTVLAVNGNSLILIIFLLKIILISKNSYNHLITCVTSLIETHKDQSEEECQWLIKFLETLKIVLTISCDSVNYNVISLSQKQHQSGVIHQLNNYRVFSQENLAVQA